VCVFVCIIYFICQTCVILALLHSIALALKHAAELMPFVHRSTRATHHDRGLNYVCPRRQDLLQRALEPLYVCVCVRCVCGGGGGEGGLYTVSGPSRGAQDVEEAAS